MTGPPSDVQGSPAVPVSGDLVRLAERLADAAGDVVRGHFRTGFAIDTKTDLTPVTVADRGAEARVREILAAERPHDGIIGEEYGAERTDAEWVWVIDPIDGTKAFVTGRPTFVNLIALLHHGTPVLGVINQPIVGDRWVGVHGVPTRHNGRPVSVRTCPNLDAAILSATSPDLFRPGAESDAFARVADRVAVATYGGDGYVYGLLASGFLDLVVEATMQVYDFCALVPVVIGAGGWISDWWGQPMRPGSDGTIVASGDRRVYDAALTLLRDAAPS